MRTEVINWIKKHGRRLMDVLLVGILVWPAAIIFGVFFELVAKPLPILITTAYVMCIGVVVSALCCLLTNRSTSSATKTILVILAGAVVVGSFRMA